jgi:hypothetical protein
MKKFLDKNDLAKLVGVFKDVKTCEKIEPVFKKIQQTFFGKLVNVRSDK